jgi:hypothetical protein
MSTEHWLNDLMQRNQCTLRKTYVSLNPHQSVVTCLVLAAKLNSRPPPPPPNHTNIPILAPLPRIPTKQSQSLYSFLSFQSELKRISITSLLLCSMYLKWKLLQWFHEELCFWCKSINGQLFCYCICVVTCSTSLANSCEGYMEWKKFCYTVQSYSVDSVEDPMFRSNF